MRGRSLALALLFIAAPLGAQNSGDGLALGRKMLAEDNPGELWIDRGKQLFHEKRGPKKTSLEQCDFRLGPTLPTLISPGASAWQFWQSPPFPFRASSWPR